MLRNYRPCDRKERCAARLARELSLTSNMEKREVASYQVMCNTRGLVKHINLSVQHVLCLFVCVRGDVACGAGLNTIEAGGEVCWGVGGLGADASVGLEGDVVSGERRAYE
jgi:hypothetical protein